MGNCYSSSSKVRGSSSGRGGRGGGDGAANTGGANDQRRPPEEREKEKGKERKGVVPCGKRTDFGYDKDFESRYAIGKLLGHGQFGYTFVATDNANGDKVAVKRIDKNKVIWARSSRFYRVLSNPLF